MLQYERTATIYASASDVFAFLSTLSNLPRYLPAISQVRLEPGGHFRATARVGGELREINGYFRVSQPERRIEWGSDATALYRGWLEVRSGETSPRIAQLTVCLSLKDQAEEQPGADTPTPRDERILQQLAAVLSRIASLVERQRRSA